MVIAQCHFPAASGKQLSLKNSRKKVAMPAWGPEKFPRSLKNAKLPKTCQSRKNTFSCWFLLLKNIFSYYQKRKYSKNRKNQKCSPLLGLSKSAKIILIAFFLIEKNTKHPRKAGDEFINRKINHSRKIWKNHLKSRNIHSFLKIPTCLYLVYSLLSNYTDGAIILFFYKTDKSVSISIVGGFPSYLLGSVMVVPSYVFEVFVCQISQV